MAYPTNEPDAPASYNGTKNIDDEAEEEVHGKESVNLRSQISIRQPKTLSMGEDELISKALRFMSTASNEKLGGIALGLAAVTYFTLGRLGLLLIGTFIGIILHASWGGWNNSSGGPEDDRKEKGMDVVKRILDWREKNVINLDNLDGNGNSSLAIRGFEDFRPETKQALNAFVDAVILDYVKWWYSPIMPTDESFPIACRQTLTSFLRSISVHLSKRRPADIFLHFLTNSSSIIVVFLDELSNALVAPQAPKGTPAEAIDEYLLMNPDSHLANILNETEQRRKLKIIAEDILENFLDRSTHQCDPTRIFLKEILANVVLEMSLIVCSKPEWINGWIVYLLEESETETNQASDLSMGCRSSDQVEDSFENPNFVKVGQTEDRKHQKRLSRAEEAMEEAIEEAKRLSQLIAEDDERRAQMQNVSDGVVLNAYPSMLSHQSLDNHWGESGSQDKFIQSQSAPTLGVTLPRSSFTSFDQLAPPVKQTALQVERHTPIRSSSSVLHNADIIIDDDSAPNDKGRIRNKPIGEYLIQIEPKALPGWLTVRRLQDFENLHEILRRIANVSGVTAFTEQHNSLPDWKMHTKASLRGELERYLRDACWHQLLADSEGMRRFLEKDQGNLSTSGNKGVGWPTPAAFETMGKGMLDALAGAPKGATEGSRAVFGGVSGVLGNIGSLGLKKKDGIANVGICNPTDTSVIAFTRPDSATSINGSRWGIDSEESLRSPPLTQSQPGPVTPMERKPSFASINNSKPENESLTTGRGRISSRSSIGDRISTSNSRDPSQVLAVAVASSPKDITDDESIILPPLPTDISDDYGSNTELSSLTHSRADSMAPTVRTSISTAPSLQSPSRNSLSASGKPVLLPKRSLREPLPLTEQETHVAVELLFAMINELYTLSSAWNIRRTLLNAAKTFLLRPGNPSLTSIQSLIQDSFIATNTSDASIAKQLHKLRQNTMPTKEELRSWPPELTPEEKERLRFKARKLLVERGMPAALTSVMGQVATGEALGRVFDCMQIGNVARGLMFGLLLQVVRAMTH